jgi:hypothetical protein
MKTYDAMTYHPTSEKLVDILCNKTQSVDRLFFRVMTAYYLTVVASMMRTKIMTQDRGEIPVNMYAINLAPSGFGKGHSTNILEDQVIDQFRHNFNEVTLPQMAAHNIPQIANARSIKNASDPDVEIALAEKEYKDLGPLFFSFDSATPAAIKDVRHKLLLANGGALNLQIDEIGTNLTTIAEALGPYLELFDVGKIKPKLTKNTSENKRREEIHGRTPANMMLYGTPNRLMNGAKTEEEMYALLDTGYARRCFFGYTRGRTRPGVLSAREIFAQRTDSSTNAFLESLSDRLGDLTDIVYAYKKLSVSEHVSLTLIEYQQDCEIRAEALGEHDEMRKAELTHRYFKALKLAGAYAFLDGTPEITEDHLYNAIILAEESGKAFDLLLTRDRPHVKLAKYMAQINRPVTQVDLIEDLPFFTGPMSRKQEILQLAITYGYQNNIIIKKFYTDGVEFLRGETLKQTKLDKIIVSYSADLAKNYLAEEVKFDDLHKMTQAKDIHWATHAFVEEHRCEDKAIPGFNLVVLDVDGGVNLNTAKALLEGYKALFYTTKRHTKAEHRFRIILPMNYELKLDAKDYKEFMANIYQWLPFDVDTGTGQRSRKWMSNPGQFEYIDGEMLDVLPFIPKTSRNEDFKSRLLDQQGLDNLERWVINNTGDGNRNKMLLRFALILVDADFDFQAILHRVTELNNKLPDKLEDAEILGTIMVTVSKAISKR